MRTFLHEFSDMLTPEGLSILKGKDTNSLLRDGKNYFAIFDGVVDRRKAEDSGYESLRASHSRTKKNSAGVDHRDERELRRTAE